MGWWNIKEKWKQIDGFEYYYVSNLGNVKSTRRWSGTKYYEREHLVSLYTNKKNGYVYASISYSANGIRKSGGGYLWHFV